MVTLLVALAVFGIVGFAPVRAHADALSVTVADDSVSVEAVGVPLADVLAKIGENAHARVLIESILAEDVAKARVSASFTALPMGAALRRLLQGRNFVLVYGSSGVDEIRVYVDGRTGFRALDASQSGRDTVTAKNTKRAPPVAQAPPPDDPVKVARLRETALGDPDVTARVEALEELGNVEDPKPLIDTLVEALGRERDRKVLGTVLDLVEQQKDAVPASALRAFVTSNRDGSARVQALELLVEQAGADQDTRLLLQTLSKSDANPTVREAAQSLLDDLPAPRGVPKSQAPPTARPQGRSGSQ